ncbi:MAG TPA: TonB-dependent receptor [Chitinophagaceae bacterium]|nr:TonB-dependent receptor [Chitinophagaceae bacterium]
MKIKFLLFLFLAVRLPATAALISGSVFDSKGMPLAGVSVSLLYPSDSTLATFAITNKEGLFTIKDAADDEYILQAALPGYYTEYEKIVQTKSEGLKILPVLVLHNNIDEQNLKEVIISGERIPVSIKGDTVEYNAGSYRVKPNAPVEDLLRQLPGMQVDEKGNIKAMGKDVKKVLVDGKEFFGTDPKIATKNLPADAIDKVQTFGKHSDESAFSGIDDGTRDQTINLKLKADKKAGYFGELRAGLASGQRGDAAAKAFQFRPKSQLAALGTLNNINQFGFSFDDYINFNGGMGNLMNGGGMNNLDELPIDFGQPITGKNTSGAVGFNYGLELRRQNRFSINYIGNGLSKTQNNLTDLTNYLPSGANYRTEEQETFRKDNLTNNVSGKWYDQIDSANQLILSLNAQQKNNTGNNQASSAAITDADTVNRITEDNQEAGSAAKLNLSSSWVHKVLDTKWKLLQSGVDLSYAKEQSRYNWKSNTHFPSGSIDLLNHQFQDNETERQQANLFVSAARLLWKNIYLEPKLSMSLYKELLLRTQGTLIPERRAVDSLSPQINNEYWSLSPGLSLKNGSHGHQWNIGLQAKRIWMKPALHNGMKSKSVFSYLLPSMFWRKEMRSGESLELNYSTQTQMPQARQLLPVLYFSNPLSGIRGDLALQPEYQHSVHLAYMHHNQFELSSLFADIGGQYTKNKIGTAINILPNLTRQAQWINTPYAANLHFDGSYSRPLRRLGIDINVDINEGLQLSESPVNGVANQNTALMHQLGLSINNRKKKDKWNARIGFVVQVSDARYSISRELNNVFANYSGTGYLSYQPNRKWFFAVDAKLKYYTAQSFPGPVSIPLLSAEITRYVLANQRASITLKAFDILDKNQAVIRQGLDNYLVQQSSDVLQRYGMLSLTYKLNKVGH